MSKTIEEVLEAIYAPDPTCRQQAVRDLCPGELKFNHPAVWDRLVEMTRDPVVSVRRNALHSLTDSATS